METAGQGEGSLPDGARFETALLLITAGSLFALNLVKSDLLGGFLLGAYELEPLSFQLLYPLAYALAALSMAAFAALLLFPRVRRAAFLASSGLVALSAFCSAGYAIGWWIAAPELMVWQDFVFIALQTLAGGLAAAALVWRGAGATSRALVASFACGFASTLAFLFAPLFEPAVSVLTRALALAGPAALLALGNAAVLRLPRGAEPQTPPTT